MMNAMMRRGYNYFFKKTHPVNVAGMVPELHKQMNRCHNANYSGRNPQQSHGKIENGEETDKVGKGLAQGTRQVELLAAVMDNVVVPKEIDFVFNTVYPITGKVNKQKAKKVN